MSAGVDVWLSCHRKRPWERIRMKVVYFRCDPQNSGRWFGEKASEGKGGSVLTSVDSSASSPAEIYMIVKIKCIDKVSLSGGKGTVTTDFHPKIVKGCGNCTPHPNLRPVSKEASSGPWGWEHRFLGIWIWPRWSDTIGEHRDATKKKDTPHVSTAKGSPSAGGRPKRKHMSRGQVREKWMGAQEYNKQMV